MISPLAVVDVHVNSSPDSASSGTSHSVGKSPSCKGSVNSSSTASAVESESRVSDPPILSEQPASTTSAATDADSTKRVTRFYTVGVSSAFANRAMSDTRTRSRA